MKQAMKQLAALCLTAVLMVSFMLPASAASKGYTFKYKGVSVSIGSDATKLIKKAGKASSTKRVKSCAHKGEDTTYTYKDFTLRTYSEKKGGTEYVMEIILKTSKVKTAEGIKVGSKEKDVTKKYGKKKASFGVYTYTKGNTKLLIEVSDKKVSEITYTGK